MKKKGVMNKIIILGLSLFFLTGTVGAGFLAPQTANAVKKIDVFIGFEQVPGLGEQALVRGNGGVIKHSYRLVPAIAASIPESAVKGLLNNPRVSYVEPDGMVYAIGVELDNTWGVKHIGSSEAHNGGNEGMGVKVAIIDSGIDYTHPDLDMNFAGGYDFVNNDVDPMDDNGHGTHVAGTVAALQNEVGVVGVAPKARLYGLKVLDSSGSGSWSNVIAALQWATENNIQVTNNSYGGGSDPGSTVMAAFDNSAATGIFHAAAAGNSGTRPGKGDNVGYPARYESVVAVAATDKNDSRASFSSTGSAVELSAPGVSINSTRLGGGYVEYNGTSMASPHVAGAAALVIAAGIADSNGNGLINDEIREVLNSTAKDLGDSGRDSKYGWGLVNVAAAVAAIVPPAPLEPTVNVSLSVDKTNYISGEDVAAILTAAVIDEEGSVISGLDFTSFVATLNGTGIAITFTETATFGTYAGSLDISGFADGVYAIEVTATDMRNISGSGLITFTIGPAPVEATAVVVNSVGYATSGGKNSDRHLDITVAVIDNLGNPVAGASVSIILNHDSGTLWNGIGTTGANGTVTFNLKNAPSGYYETKIVDMVAEGLTWDGLTPANGFNK